MAIRASTGASDNHDWHERSEPHFRLNSGETVVEQHCHKCGRKIAIVLSSDKRYAVYASVLYFYRLDDEVTRRWLSERALASAYPVMTRIKRGG
jgi:hypothetical protein